MAPAAPGWEFPVRAFHWALVALLVFSFATGKLGGSWLEWHMRSGYAILALLVFRIAWGFVGGPAARFSAFLHGPPAVIGYVRGLARGSAHRDGHNPAGGWMVVAMIVIVAVQAVTGLFSNDESSHEGPLARLVSNDTVDRMSIVHGINQWVVLGAALVHVAAIAAYAWVLRIPVASAMLRGPRGAVARAAALLGVCAVVVYWLVQVYPRAAS